MIRVLLAVAFIAGYVFRIDLFHPSVRLSIFDIVIGVIYFKFLSNPFHWIKIPHPRLFAAILVFSLIGFISLLFMGFKLGTAPLFIGGLYHLRWLLYSLVFIPLSSFSRHGGLVSTFKHISIALICVSILQYLFFPDLRPMSANHWDPHYFRITGTLLDPGFTGLIFVLIIGYFSLRPESGLFSSFVINSGAYLCLLLTYSRSSYLAFLSLLVYLSIIRKSLRFFIIAVTLFVLSISLLPRPAGEGIRLERTSSIMARVINWGQSLVIISDHPVMGVGFNLYRYAQKEYGFLDADTWEESHAGAGADSSLLFVAATAGVVGLLMYLGILYQLFWTSDLTRLFLVVIIPHSIFLNSLFYPPILLLLALLISDKPTRILR